MGFGNSSWLCRGGRKTGKRAACALLASAAALAAAVPASAQDSTATADARAVIVRPLSFFKVQDLSFGDLIRGTATGTRYVIVAPDGTRTQTGDITLVGSDHQPARFAGDGAPNQQVRIRLGAGSIQLTGPGTPMLVDQFTIGSTPLVVLGTGWNQFTLTGPSGVFNFPIGARLSVNANQAPGVYTGTFLVELQYQ